MKLFVAQSLLWSALGCAASDARPASSPTSAQPPAVVQRDCAAFATRLAGPHLYSNNTFNAGKAGGPYEQCLLERRVDGRTELGWSWRWPGFEPSSFGYPEIIFGKKPWEESTTDARLPRRISELVKLGLDYELSTEGTGSHPLTLGIWLSRSDAASGATWRSIAAEVAIWLDFDASSAPEGTQIEAIQVGGTPYELWRHDNHGDRGDGQGWTYFTAKGPRYGLSAQLSVDGVLTALVQKGHITKQLYVSSLEFGNEVRSGTGSTWVKRYDVTVEVGR